MPAALRQATFGPSVLFCAYDTDESATMKEHRRPECVVEAVPEDPSRPDGEARQGPRTSGVPSSSHLRLAIRTCEWRPRESCSGGIMT